MTIRVITQLQRLEEVVVAFIAIEDGDDSSVAQNAISQIKNSMEKIGCKLWFVKESVINTRQNGEHNNIDTQVDRKGVMYVKFLYNGMVFHVLVVE